VQKAVKRVEAPKQTKAVRSGGDGVEPDPREMLSEEIYNLRQQVRFLFLLLHPPLLRIPN
jgi:hypothetical protein